MRNVSKTIGPMVGGNPKDAKCWESHDQMMRNVLAAGRIKSQFAQCGNCQGWRVRKASKAHWVERNRQTIVKVSTFQKGKLQKKMRICFRSYYKELLKVPQTGQSQRPTNGKFNTMKTISRAYSTNVSVEPNKTVLHNTWQRSSNLTKSSSQGWVIKSQGHTTRNVLGAHHKQRFKDTQ